MRYIFGNDRLDEKLWQLLAADNPRDRIYVYRLRGEKPVRPAMFIGCPFPQLMEFLRDEHGGGEFQIMIRRGETMLLSGVVGIAVPLAARR